MKTVAIKVEDDLHTQLLLVAQLEGTTLTDVIRQAVEGHVEALRNGGGLAAKAETLMAEIEQETAARKQAVQALISELGDKPDATTKRSRRTGAA